MAIKLGVHVLCSDGRKGFVSRIDGESCEVTLRDDGGVICCDSADLKTLKGRPRKVAESVAAAVAETCEAPASL